MGFMSRLMALARNDGRLREKGDAARDARDWVAAVNLYGRYLTRVPEDAGIWVQLGHARKESGDVAGAESAYLRALSIEPANPDTHVQLGHAEKLQGRLNDAVARYRKAAQLDPTFAPALEELEKYDFDPGASAAAPARSAHASDTSSQHLAEIDRRLGLLADQVSAVKAVAFEVQKLRRRADALDRQVAELGQRLADLASGSAAGHSEIERRISSLEGQSPAVQGRFSALLEQFGAITACRKDLDRQAALIDDLMRQSRPA